MHYYFLYLKQKCISIFQINGLDRVTTQLLHQTTESKQGNQIIFTKKFLLFNPKMHWEEGGGRCTLLCFCPLAFKIALGNY